MMTIRNAIPWLIVLSVVGNATASGKKAEEPWPSGAWVLCDDPDGSPKDTLQFNRDGTGLVIRAKRNIEFVYKHAGQSVSLLASVNGRAIPIELMASPSLDRLLLRSDETGNTASYVRSDGAAAGHCSIK